MENVKKGMIILCATIVALTSGSVLPSCSRAPEPRFSPLSEEAKADAREAAAVLLERAGGTERELHDAILSARAAQSEYLLMGDTVAAEDFQECFEATVRESNESLANLIF